MLFLKSRCRSLLNSHQMAFDWRILNDFRLCEQDWYLFGDLRVPVDALVVKNPKVVLYSEFFQCAISVMLGRAYRSPTLWLAMSE